MFLTESSGIQIGTLGAINVNQVLATGSLGVQTADNAQSNLVSASNLVLVTMSSGIETLSTGAITATGNMLLQTGGGTSDITLGAVVTSTVGNMSINAGQNILQNANLLVNTSGKTIDLVAGSNITMANGTSTTSTDGNILLYAGTGNITIETLAAGAGSVSITAAATSSSTVGRIIDLEGTLLEDSEVDIMAFGLMLNAGYSIGSGINHIETTVTTVTANAGAGGIFVTESDGVTVDRLTMQVNRVAATGVAAATTNAAQEDLSATGAGNIVLSTTSGALVVNAGTAASTGVAGGTGNLFLEAKGGILTIEASLSVSGGSVSLLASALLSQATSTTISSSGSGAIDVQAASITMTDGAAISAGLGNIRMVAANALQLGSLSTSGDVSLSASTITDACISGTETTNITADELRIVTTGIASGNGAGTGSNHLELTVARLAAHISGIGTGGLFLTEGDGILIGTLSAINVNQVLVTGSLGTQTTDTAQSDLFSSSNLVLVTTAGSIETLSTGGAITATGNMLLQAGGSTSDITLGAANNVSGGHISLNAGQDILQNANIMVNTSGKTIDVVAGHNITMAAGTSTTSMDGNILLYGGTGNITIETLAAGSGSVSITAAATSGSTVGKIIDLDGISLEDSEVDITAVGLMLNAGYGIGSGANHLETTVTTVTANTGAGGVFVTESDGVTVDTQTIQVNRVAATGAAMATTNVAHEDLSATGTGNIVLTSTSGALVVNAGMVSSSGVAVTGGTGNVSLEAKSGALTMAASLSASGGSVSLRASALLSQGTSTTISTSDSGTIDVQAASITMADGAAISAGSGNIRMVAANALQLGSLSTSGDISLSASTITDACISGTETTNITADELRIVTTGIASGNGAGTGSNHLELTVAKLAAHISGTGTGGLFLTEGDGILIGTLSAINVNQVLVTGSLGTQTTDTAQSDLFSSSHLVLVTTAGSIETLSTGGAITATGNMLLKAVGNISDITLGAAVMSKAGSISLNAGNDIKQNSSITVSGGSGMVDLLAGRTIEMQQATSSISTSASGGNILLTATSGSITLETLDAGSGNVALSATNTTNGAINDGDAVDSSNTEVDIFASGLILKAGYRVGSDSNHLETTVTTLTASAGAGGMFVTESDGVIVDTLTIQVDRVDATAVAAATTNMVQADLVTSASGCIVLISTSGNIVLEDGDINGLTTGGTNGYAVNANGSGNVLVQTLTTGNITANTDIFTGTGSVSVLAANSVRFISGADIRSLGTNSAGTIDVVAANGGDVTMAADSLFASTHGSIRVLAANSIEVGVIATAATATPGDGSGLVSLLATAGSIVDAQNLDSSTNDSIVNVTASGLRLWAGVGIGMLGTGITNPFETDVTTLTARAAAGGIALLESNAVTVGDVAVTVNRVDSTGAASVVPGTTDAVQSDLMTVSGNGSIVLRTTNGKIILNDGTGGAGTAVTADGMGNILIEAISASTNVEANADVVSTNGNISVIAGGSLAFTTDADIRTGSAGTIDVNAGLANTHMVTMSVATLFTTNSGSGDIRLKAGGNIQVGDIVTAGDVSLFTSSGKITDADALLDTNSDSAGDTNDSSVDVTASGLRLWAGVGIGDSANHLETAVGTVSGRATSGGIYLLEKDGVTVGDVAVSVNRVAFDVSTATTNTVDATQSDLVTTAGNGNIVLQSTMGSIILNDGMGTGLAGISNTVISSNGSGNVLLQTVASDGDITANTDIASATGSVSILAGHSVTFITAADVRTAGSNSTGTIDVVSANGGSVTMAANSMLWSINGNIRVVAGSALQLGIVNTSGDVSLNASTITDAWTSGGTDTVNITADELSIVTTGTADGNGAGAASNRLELTVARLAGDVKGTGTTSGLFLTEADGIQIGTLSAINVNQVLADGTVLTQTMDAAQSNLASASNLVLVTTAGSIATLSTGGAITITGNMLLQAGGSNDITLGAAVTNNALGGNISLNAGQDILQNANIVLNTSGKTIDLVAGRSITMADNTLTQTASGATSNIMLTATAGAITFEKLDAGIGNVALYAINTTNGSINDGDDVDTSNADVDILASGLILKAGYGIGSGTNHLETMVTTVTANAGAGGVFMTESDGVTVDTQTIQVNRVAATGVAAATTNAGQEDLVATGAGNIVLTSTIGDLILNAAASASNAVTMVNGNVQLEAMAGALTLNASLDGGSGNVTLLASGLISQAVAGSITTMGGTIDVESTSNAITMLDGAKAQTNGGNIRYTASGIVTVGLLDARTTNDRSDSVLTNQMSWGSVSIVSSGASIVDNNDTTVDVYAKELRLTATNAIGALGVGANALETEVATVTASAGTGGVNLHESSVVTIGSVTMVPVNRVMVTGGAGTSDIIDSVAQAGVVTTSASSGSIVVVSGGVMMVNNQITADGAGNIRLETTVGAIGINAGLLSGSGHITVIAKSDLIQSEAGDITTTGSGTIDVEAGGKIEMTSGAVGLDTVVSGAKDIRYEAKGGNLQLGSFSTDTDGTGGTIVLIASGSIVDDDTAVDVTANKLYMQAGNAIADGNGHVEIAVSTLSLSVGSGGAFVAETDGLTVGTVALNSLQRVENTAAVTVQSGSWEDLNATNNGALVLTVQANGLLVTSGVDSTGITAAGSGNVRLDVTGALTLYAALDGGSGNVTLLASGTLMQGAAGDISTSDGTIDINAGTGITMADGALTQTTNGNVRYESSVGDITLGEISTGMAATTTGKVLIIAMTGSVLGTGDTSVDITASDLLLTAGVAIAASGNHLETQVINLTAQAGNGSIFIDEIDDIMVTAVSVTVERVLSTGELAGTQPSSSQEELTTGGSNGNIVLISNSGNIVITDGADANVLGVSADGTGNIRLEAKAGSIDNRTGVTSGGGNITMIGSVNVLQSTNATADISTSGTGTIDIEATTGVISMLDGAETRTSGSGNIHYSAATTISVGSISTGGNVSLNAGSTITDSGTTDTDVTAVALRLSATQAGTAEQHLATTVTMFSANVGGGIFMSETDSVTIDTVAAVTVNRVKTDGFVADSTVTDAAALSDLVSGDALVLQTTNGSIITVVTNGDISAGSNILLLAGGSTSDITFGAAVTSTAGNISVNAGQDMLQNANIVNTGGKTIDFEAGRNITMADGAVAQTEGGNIRLTGGSTITVGVLDARTMSDRSSVLTNQTLWGSVSIFSGASIVDNTTESTMMVDVYAKELKLSAKPSGDGAVGAGSNHLETEVAILSANVGGGGLFITEATVITIGQTENVTVTRVGINGTTTETTDLLLSNLASTGNLVLVTAAGSIETLSTTGAILATGNMLLQAGGSASDITLGAAITSTAGNITINAGQDIKQNAAISVTSGTGSIDLFAVGSITMADGTSSTSTSAGGGNIRYRAGTDVTLALLSSGSGNVAVSATSGFIKDGDAVDGSNTEVDIIASCLILSAGNGVGTGTNHLETTVTTLTASVGAGGLFVTENDGITIGSVTVTVNGIGTTAATPGSSANVTVSGVSSSSNGNLVVQAAGSLLVSNAVSANGSGNVLLTTTSGTLSVNAAVSSGTGNITVLNTIGAMTQGAFAISTDGGTIDIEATDGASGSITLVAGSTVVTDGLTAVGGNIRLKSGAGMAVTGINAGTASVSLYAGGAITDGGETATDVVSSNLRLYAVGAVGEASVTSNGLLDTNVGTLSAIVGDSLYISEANAVTVDTVAAVMVNRVKVDGSVTGSMVSDASQSDLRTLGQNGNIVLVAGGAVTLNDGTDVTGEDNTDGKSVSANGSGGILLNAGGALAINTNIVSGSGNITLKAMDEITVASGVQLTTAAPGTISMNAGGALTMAGNSTIEATNSSLRLRGYGDVMVGNLRAANASVVSERGAIINAAGSTKNVIATTLRLQAYGSIGSENRPFTTQVKYMSADPKIDGAGIYIEEDDDIVITSVIVNVLEITSIAGMVTVVDVSLSDLVTSKNGTIQLVTLDGSITITDGDDGNGNGVAISANGTGDVILRAGGSGSDVIINAAVTTDTGKVVIFANHDVVQRADIETSGSSISVESATGSITMSDGVQTTNSNGVTTYHSYEDVALGLLSAESGAVQVYAKNGSITTSTAGVNVSSESVVLQAGDNVGIRHIAPLQLSVDRVAAEAVTGGMDIVNDTTITAASIDGGEGLVQGLSAGDGLSLKSLHGDIVIVAPVNTKGTADAILSFPEGTLQADKFYFDDAGTFMNVQYKQLQFLSSQSQNLFVPDAFDAASINDRLEIKYHQSAHDRAEQGSSNTPERRPQMYRTVESLLVEQVAVEEQLDAYVEIKNGHLHFKWGDVKGADSYLLVVEHEKTEFASRWLEDISWAPFESFPAGIYDWSVYSWATEGLKLVYGPMQFKI